MGNMATRKLGGMQEFEHFLSGFGDPYQVANFNRILRRLIRVETLWLVDNSLVDLSAIRLPSYRILNMNKNHLTSFKQLPKIPQIHHLSLAENHIETLIGAFQFTVHVNRIPSAQEEPL
ncbi:uncharacterized protein V5649_019293 isoform 1-T1 [Rhynchonycteris naso]